jgi:predicted regulator of Ras-like GTPase activity (Roadblock/LC7/MglB family)
MSEILNKLKAKKIMAALVQRDGTPVASNFTLHEGTEEYIASSFNVGDAFLREVGEEAKELVISTDRGNLVLRDLGKDGVLMAQILTKEQYAFYKELVGGAAPAKEAKAKKAEGAGEAKKGKKEGE